jgi:hypothetical protein
MNQVTPRAAEMKYRGHDAKRDANELTIVRDLQKVGAKVKRLNQPCDLLVRFRYQLFLIEVSNPEYPHRKRAKEQLEFFEEFGVPIVTTSDEALRIIGAL